MGASVSLRLAPRHSIGQAGPPRARVRASRLVLTVTPAILGEFRHPLRTLTSPSPVMSTPRRRFLSWLGSASLVGVAGSPSRAFAAAPQHLPRSDEHAAPIADTWDMSWTARVTGKYKAVFDSPEVHSGGALFRAVSWREQYKEVYGAEPAETTAVLVVRHLGFYLAMNDEYWARFEVGKELKERDGKGKKWAKANPVGGAGVDAGAANAKFTMQGFLASGGIVLACGWSFGGAAAQLAKADKLDRETARARAKEMLLPGVILQPNGIFAALRAQEAGCAYVMAS